ncbi:hypothetical protein [Desulforhopalus singaporensis]|uniref:TFIIB-type domain-containing protein n=1 Tax=Desulforhopalus singaporensis TaxID=91360 RepID=A0A1H0PAF2_9BACT|nr:hypothetical protein [Desulforhopalus singaporensis]SDP01730.1 hypothetical protein SAMN05660330_01574 [Desulforhopalus singaporensis]
MGILNKLFGRKPPPSKRYEEGCIKCGELSFTYDEYHKEYYCNDCGWVVNEKPIGKIEITEKYCEAEAEESENTDSLVPSLGEIQEIVKAYGYCMEQEIPNPSCIADSSQLPYPKATIKAALLVALKLEEDEQMKNALKLGYISLADWQDGVGPTPYGVDTTKINLNGDIQEAVKTITDQMQGDKDWLTIAKAESEQLRQDLINAGL